MVVVCFESIFIETSQDLELWQDHSHPPDLWEFTQVWDQRNFLKIDI